MSKFLNTLIFVFSWKRKKARNFYKNGLKKVILKDFVGAIAEFSMSIEVYPKIERAYFSRGMAKYSLKDYTGAIEDLTMAIENIPHDEDV